MSAILIIDDEPSIREVFKDILEDEGYTVFLAPDGPKGLNILKTEDVDLVFLDIWLPGMGGIEVLERILNEFQGVEVAIISGHANVEIAVKAIKMGAYDILEKPLGIDRILLLCRNVLELEKLRRENKSLRAILNDEMLGNNKEVEKIRLIIEQSADSTATVLITGENGTGKELVAREIHAQSPRAKKPFIPVNCAAIPENLIESELFGHEKGSFTGAVVQRKGKFEMASGGTLFLDEVADLALSAQAKILRAIQEQQIERVGGENTIFVDVRIVAATNKNMRDLVSSGEFREDLFYRLHVVSIEVPPLRKRLDDIDIIAKHFLTLYSSGEKNFSPESLQELKDYHWPGNIRQLKNVLHRITLFSENNTISIHDVQEALQGELTIPRRLEEDEYAMYDGMSLLSARQQFEYGFIVQRLKEFDYNISHAAHSLGMYPSSLHNKIRKYGIEVDK